MNKRSRLLWFLSFAIVLPLALVSNDTSYAAPGDLDPTFGAGGKVTTDFTVAAIGSSIDVAVQQDGKVVVAGTSVIQGDSTRYDFTVARFNPDGNLDTTFGESGRAAVDFAHRADQVFAVQMQSDGKILVAGEADIGETRFDPTFALARFNQDGSPDISFGNAGKVTTNMVPGNDFERIWDMAVQPNGKIVAAGIVQTGVSTGPTDFGLARYNPDGTLDASFGSGGKVFTRLSGASSEAFGLVIQPDGKLVAVGRATILEGSEPVYYLALARYNPDGTLDQSFGDGGEVVTLRLTEGSSVGLQPDGRIVVAGSSLTTYTRDAFLVARFMPNGNPDSSFGDDGVVTTSFGGGNTSARDLVIQPDNKILVSGDAGTNLALARYNADGSPDSTFDGDGKVLNSNFPSAAGVVLTANGKIAVASGYDMLGAVQFNSDGSLDRGFGQEGKATATGALSTDNPGYAMAVQPDGKIVVAGRMQNLFCPTYCPRTDIAVARYMPDGRLDPTFGTNGRVVTQYTSGSFIIASYAYAIAIQPDGKIVVGGRLGDANDTDFLLIRYNSNGSLDSSFDGDGRVVTPFGTSTAAVGSLAIDSQGRIIAAGYTDYDYNYNFALARYKPNGSLDLTFGSGGKVDTDFDGTQDIANAVGISGSRIVVAGYRGTQTGSRFILAGYNSNGRLDTSFGSGGFISPGFGGQLEEALALVVQPDGKIIQAGYTGTQTTGDFALARHNPDGTLDYSFGSAGRVTTHISTDDVVFALAVGTDGKIVAAGYSTTGSDTDFAVTRYNSNGSLDRSFGGTGKVTTDFSVRDVAFSVAIRPDNRVITAGYMYSGNLYDFALARYLEADIPVTPTPAPTSTPVPPRCPGERFTDVCPGDFFYKPTLGLSEAGYISGYDTTPPCESSLHIPCFKPYSNITRGQVAKVVSLAAGFRETPTSQSFQDVPPSNPFYPFIERMASRGIIGGYECGGQPGEPCIAPDNRPYFRWGSNVTRGQISKMIAQAFGFGEPVSGRIFEDVPTTNVFYEYVGRMAQRGIIGGYGCGTAIQEPCVPPGNRPYFRPNNSLTRGQTSKMVYLAWTQPAPTTTPTTTPMSTSTSTPTSTPTFIYTPTPTSTSTPLILPTATPDQTGTSTPSPTAIATPTSPARPKIKTPPTTKGKLRWKLTGIRSDFDARISDDMP